jgi:thiosulfate dehydrogenase (quinone) large subunit
MNNLSSKPFGIIRILFGFVWLANACFKWQPAFLNNFASYLSTAAQGQPRVIAAWINFWLKIVAINPHAFAVATAIIETLIALTLIFGLFTRTAIVIGIIFSLIIWTTAEGFGGPYMAGSTDIGCAIIYVFVFFSLWFGHAWEYFSLDKNFSSTAG